MAHSGYRVHDTMGSTTSLLKQIGLFAFFFVRVASHRLRSALISALHSTNYVLSSPSSITKKCCPHQLHPPSMSLCNAHFSDARFLSMSANWHPKHDHKLTFLSMTATYVHTHFQKIDPSFRALGIMYSIIGNFEIIGFVSLHAWQQLYTILRNMYPLPDSASTSYKICFNCTTVQLMCSSQILLWMPFGKFHPGFEFFTYIVTHSYSSCPFSCNVIYRWDGAWQSTLGTVQRKVLISCPPSMMCVSYVSLLSTQRHPSSLSISAYYKWSTTGAGQGLGWGWTSSSLPHFNLVPRLSGAQSVHTWRACYLFLHDHDIIKTGPEFLEQKGNIRPQAGVARHV